MSGPCIVAFSTYILNQKLRQSRPDDDGGMGRHAESVAPTAVPPLSAAFPSPHGYSKAGRAAMEGRKVTPRRWHRRRCPPYQRLSHHLTTLNTGSEHRAQQQASPTGMYAFRAAHPLGAGLAKNSLLILHTPVGSTRSRVSTRSSRGSSQGRDTYPAPSGCPASARVKVELERGPGLTTGK